MCFSSEGPGPFCSFAVEYVWQIEGDDLTIWHGVEGSPARSSCGATATGAGAGAGVSVVVASALTGSTAGVRRRGAA